MTLLHDFVDCKLGLQLALQRDWPCLKKKYLSVLLMVLKTQLFFLRKTSTWQKVHIYTGQQRHV